MTRITDPRPARRILLVAALVALLLLLALVADRVLHARAEARIAGQITEAMSLEEEPDITVDGFPFLTQLAAGELSSVRGAAEGVVLDTPDQAVEIRRVRVHARQVTTGDPARVGDLRLSGTVTDATIRSWVRDRLPGAEVATTDAGVEISGELLGLPVALDAEPQVREDALVVQVTGARLGDGAVELATLRSLVPDDLLELEIDVSDLPLGLRPEAAETVDGGVRLSLSGRDVTLAP
ncbi:DUF2993 domain-containing protein [Georgenia deserti]|uniref:DUF2993 domain-containing protein n=1 Tax=Georgenia deserti TaxID=2093781 RepID=A0ABW4L6L1_9MICO